MDRRQSRNGRIDSSGEGARLEAEELWSQHADRRVDLVAAGIIGPAKVTRTALQNAASVAGLLLTVECVVVARKAKARPGPCRVVARETYIRNTRPLSLGNGQSDS